MEEAVVTADVDGDIEVPVEVEEEVTEKVPEVKIEKGENLFENVEEEEAGHHPSPGR